MKLEEMCSVSLYLVYAIISVSFLRGIFTVLAPLAAANNSNWFALLPAPRLSSIFVIDWDVAVECQCPGVSQKILFKYAK